MRSFAVSASAQGRRQGTNAEEAASAYHLFGAAVRPDRDLTRRCRARDAQGHRREMAGAPRDGRQQYDVQAAEEVKRYVSECEAVGIDPGKAARLASGPEPALSALGFFQALRGGDGRYALGRMHGRGLGGRDRPRPRIAALLQRSFDALPYEERDEIDDLAAIDQERFEEELAAYQAAAAKRRKTGHGGGGGGENDSAQPQQPPAKSSSSSSPPQQVMIKVKGLK